jgi:hypothetical protein
VEHPRLRLTEAARDELLRAIGRISEYAAVVTVAWAERGPWLKLRPDGTEESGVIEAGWGVGFYDPTKIPPEEIVQIDGIDFVFAQGHISMRLDGKALDYVDGKFIVLDHAI